MSIVFSISIFQFLKAFTRLNIHIIRFLNRKLFPQLFRYVIKPLTNTIVISVIPYASGLSIRLTAFWSFTCLRLINASSEFLYLA